MECECFTKTPEFNDFDNTICINCGKKFENKIFYNYSYVNCSNNDAKQKSLYKNFYNYIYNLEQKFNIENHVKKDIMYLYLLSTETYKNINNYKKIKNFVQFCYLSCWFVFKNYNKLNVLVYLENKKPPNVNKFNKFFYIIAQSDDFNKNYLFEHNINKNNILFDDYSWFIYKTLYNKNKLDLFDNIYPQCKKMFELDKFISFLNFEKYILSLIE